MMMMEKNASMKKLKMLGEAKKVEAYLRFFNIFLELYVHGVHFFKQNSTRIELNVLLLATLL